MFFDELNIDMLPQNVTLIMPEKKWKWTKAIDSYIPQESLHPDKLLLHFWKYKYIYKSKELIFYQF